MDNKPLISVALCTYNGEKYISEQLESIIDQTYKKLEIIVLDDASTDSTFDIVSAYANRDSRIKCFRNNVNLGFNKNFEKAPGLTSGDFIAISDQDDIWAPGKLQVLLDNIGDNWLIFSNSTYMGGTKQGKLLKNFNMPANYRGFLLRNYVTGHTVLMRREFLNFASPFPQGGFYDWWMGLVAIYHHKITFYDEVLTFYRVHDESVIKKQLAIGKAAVEFENITAMLKAFAEYKNLKADDRVFIKRLEEAYRLKGTGSRSIPLMKMVYKYYREFFPNRKPWKSRIKFFFAMRFSGGIKR